MGGKGRIRCKDSNKTRRVGKKNKTNNDGAFDSMNATTNDANAQANNVIGSTSGKQQVDADGTKVVANDTINATTNNVDTHTNNAAGPTSGKARVDDDRTKGVADNTINDTTNNAGAHTNNVIETTTTDSDALSIMKNGSSDVILEGTNNADVTKETDAVPHINTGARYQTNINNASKMGVKDACEVVDIVQQVCAENLPVGHGSEEQNAILAKTIDVEQCFNS
jgi:hypothetical protein